MMEGLQSFRNIGKIPELKRRVLVTLGLLAAYRLGAHVPTPGIDGHALAQFFNQVQGTLLGMVDLFSGGNLRRLTVFALGIMPYISASIILQLLTVVIPALGAAGQGRRGGEEEDHPVHALRHHRALASCSPSGSRSGSRACGARAAAPSCRIRAGASASSR